jgi:hypothetical protein
MGTTTTEHETASTSMRTTTRWSALGTLLATDFAGAAQLRAQAESCMDRVGVYRWVEAKFYPWGDAFADGIAKCWRCEQIGCRDGARSAWEPQRSGVDPLEQRRSAACCARRKGEHARRRRMAA